MSQRCVIADAFRFAAEGRSVQGTVETASLERLADLIERSEGSLAFRVAGEQSDDGHWQLRVLVKGSVVLKCQRCLSELDWPLEVDSTLWLVKSSTEIPEEELEDDSRDAIEVRPDMDVHALVEDEILLALPVVPRHDQCETPLPLSGGKKESPFAALSGLGKPFSPQQDD